VAVTRVGRDRARACARPLPPQRRLVNRGIDPRGADVEDRLGSVRDERVPDALGNLYASTPPPVARGVRADLARDNLRVARVPEADLNDPLTAVHVRSGLGTTRVLELQGLRARCVACTPRREGCDGPGSWGRAEDLADWAVAGLDLELFDDDLEAILRSELPSFNGHGFRSGIGLGSRGVGAGACGTGERQAHSGDDRGGRSVELHETPLFLCLASVEAAH